MTEKDASLSLQKKLLQSLGFGFVIEPLETNEAAPAEAAPAPLSSARRTKTPPAVRTPSGPVAEPMTSGGLDDLATMIRGCTRCDLQYTRKCAVPGRGMQGADLFIIAELPAPEEDAVGEPYEGEIGQMLAKMLAAMKYKPEEVFVTHSVKCRSAGGRPPQEAEVKACAPYLLRQIELVKPKAIISFGPSGLWALLPREGSEGLSAHRGKWLDFQGTPLMATFPLHFIHNNAARKRTVWQDMQILLERFPRP